MIKNFFEPEEIFKYREKLVKLLHSCQFESFEYLIQKTYIFYIHSNYNYAADNLSDSN